VDAKSTGEHLGDVEGSSSIHLGTPYYVVADAGGWFKSKHFSRGRARALRRMGSLVSDSTATA
jgi:hypothetical protein